MNDFLITNIGVLATPEGTRPLSGRDQSKIRIVKNAAIATKNNKITYVGEMKNAPRAEDVMDAGGRLVTPGLVDSHTHMVFGGFRQHEFGAKIAGKSYMEILNEGGGILSTVEATRNTRCDELFAKSVAFMNEMIAHGTTTVEIKSGYGLNLETELIQLQVIKDLAKSYNAVPTFMGAHAIPKEYKGNPEAYVNHIIEEMIPSVASRKLAMFCDVFCEDSVFTAEQARRILKEAKAFDMGIKIHADEIKSTGGALLAAELGAISAEHLLESSDAHLRTMASSGVIAVLLPAASFYLDKNYAKARDMVEKSIPVAVATDFNPGSSPGYNMQFVLNLACLKLKLNPAEALTAATLNGAAAIGLANTKGSLEIGKDADMVVWDCPDLDYLFYRFGNNQVYEVFVGA